MRKNSAVQRIAIFASGKGTNARAIMAYFKQKEATEVALIVTNKPKAGVIDFAHEYSIPVLVVNRSEFTSGSFLDVLASYNIDLIVLAGFLWLIPAMVIQHYRNKIINIHPALLPKYGGKGMYGMFVHEAVARSGDKETGITIHFADENYDEGKIIAQFRCDLEPGDTPKIIAKKVQALEHKHYPETIARVLSQMR